MPELAGKRRFGLAAISALLMLVLMLIGAWIWFRPFLVSKQDWRAEVPTPPALNAVSEFAVPRSGEACMGSVTVTPNSHLAVFGLRPAKQTPRGGPPVRLSLSGPGYHASLSVPGGYPGGGVTLPIAAPSHPTITTACFINEGRSTVLFDGTIEPRTVARSPTTVDGVSVVGDIALTFLEGRDTSMLQRLGLVFDHASNLTERLVPVWLIWALAVLVAFGVPAGVVAALYRALREDSART